MCSYGAFAAAAGRGQNGLRDAPLKQGHRKGGRGRGGCRTSLGKQLVLLDLLRYVLRQDDMPARKIAR